MQVVSIELVPNKLIAFGFQSKEVKGAEKSFYYIILNYTFAKLRCKETLLLSLTFQILRFSPDVASKSGFPPVFNNDYFTSSGIHSSLVGGYKC